MSTIQNQKVTLTGKNWLWVRRLFCEPRVPDDDDLSNKNFIPIYSVWKER